MRYPQYTLRAIGFAQNVLLLDGRHHQTLVDRLQGKRKPELPLGRVFPLRIVLPSE